MGDMKITRVYSDVAGESHFEDVEVALKDAGTIGRLSAPWPAESVLFRETEPMYDYDWHCAPHRQFIILLDGEIEIETSDGAHRKFKGGETLLMEDVTGRGHKTKALNNTVRHSIFVRLPAKDEQS